MIERARAGAQSPPRAEPLALAAVLLACFAFYREPLLEGAALYFRDLQIFFVPMKRLLAQAFSAGELPFWDFRVHNGVPFLADPQSGVLYPPSLLFLAGETGRALGLYVTAHVALAAGGAFLLALALGARAAGAAVAALAYALGGWMTSSVNMLNVLSTAAWAPLVVLAFHRLWTGPSPGRLAVAALALALQFLAGLPDGFLMTGLVLVLRGAVVFGVRRPAWLAAMLAAYALAALLTAPQWLATWEAFRLSTRVGGLPLDQVLRFSADWGQIATLLRPPPLGSADWDILAAFPDGHVPLFLSLYLGFAVLALALSALFRPTRETWLWLGIALLGVFLALGRHNPLAVPLLALVSILRSPEKYLFLTQLGLALLAAFGVRALAGTLPALGRLRGFAAAAAAVAVAAELGLVNRGINQIAPPGYYRFDDVPEARIIAAQPGRVYAAPVATGEAAGVRELYDQYRAALSPNAGALAGVEYVNGIAFIVLADHGLQRTLLASLEPSRQLPLRLAFFGARYLAASDPAYDESANWLRAAHKLTPRLWRLHQRPPELFVPETVTEQPAEFIHQAVDTPEYGDGRAAFVEPGGAAAGEGRAGEVSGFVRGWNGARARVLTPTGGLLVWRQNHYPGWQARVDGVAAEVVRANHFFMGVAVPPGEHTVEWRFEPTTWRLGLALAGAGLAAVAALGLLGARRK